MKAYAFYGDNSKYMKLEANGKASLGKPIQHLYIKLFLHDGYDQMQNKNQMLFNRWHVCRLYDKTSCWGVRQAFLQLRNMLYTLKRF